MSSIVSVRGAHARWAVLLLAMVLAACYPRYNWRELPVADGLAVLAFPARIDVAQREVVLAGLKVSFELTSAKVDDSLFSFGYAQLPPESALPAREAARQALIDSLAKGMGQEAPASAQEGTVFKLESLQGESPLVVFARVLLHRDVVMRVVASGPPEELTEEIAREFMRSLVLR